VYNWGTSTALPPGLAGWGAAILPQHRLESPPFVGEAVVVRRGRVAATAAARGLRLVLRWCSEASRAVTALHATAAIVKARFPVRTPPCPEAILGGKEGLCRSGPSVPKNRYRKSRGTPINRDDGELRLEGTLRGWNAPSREARCLVPEVRVYSWGTARLGGDDAISVSWRRSKTWLRLSGRSWRNGDAGGGGASLPGDAVGLPGGCGFVLSHPVRRGDDILVAVSRMDLRW